MNLTEQDFEIFLNSMMLSIDREVIENAHKIWQLVKQYGLPVSMPTGDGGIQLSWTKDDHHISIDIYANEWDYFYRNRKIDETKFNTLVQFENLPLTLKYCFEILNGTSNTTTQT